MDFSHFKNSIGKEFTFETVHTSDGKPVYKELFKGVLDKVGDGHIIIKYICVSVDRHFNVTTEVQQRKLLEGEFTLYGALNR